MISLPVFTASHAHRVFASAERPLRPSSMPKFFKCPMSVFLTDDTDSSNPAADTGSLVHEAAKAFHNTEGDVPFRKEAGDLAIAAALAKFPKGDQSKALTIFASYAADKENQEAVVLWCEAKIRLTLPAAPEDPTGMPIIIEGTLDQVRKKNDKKCVWDIKTGSGKDANETVTEYVLQQCVYTLGAVETLDPEIVCGGFIYTPGYDKPRGRRHLPLDLTVDDCRMLLSPLPHIVALIRQGVPMFMPSTGACEYCPVRPFSHCVTMYKGIYL